MLTKGLHEICQKTIDSPLSCCTELRREEVGGGEETGKGKGEWIWANTERWQRSGVAVPRRKGVTQDRQTLEGQKQWDQGQRVSKSPPRTEGRGHPSSFQSSQSNCSLCIWFRKKKLEKRPRWGNGSGEDVASCANIYWYPMQIRCPSLRIAVYMQSHTISMCVPGRRPLLNSYWKLISRLEREPVNTTVARLQR